METMAILTETQIPQGEQRTDEVFSIHAGDFLEIIPQRHSNQKIHLTSTLLEGL